MSDGMVNSSAETREFVTIMVGDQLCGIDVLKVHDILGPQQITPVPLAAPEVSGLLNLRGKIVTAINMRKRLGVKPRPREAEGMNVVVERKNELYSLGVDSVGEVLCLPSDDFERCPVTLDPVWRRFSQGVYRLKEGLLVVMDIEMLLDYGAQADAA